MSLQLGMVFINHEGAIPHRQILASQMQAINAKQQAFFINREEHEGHEGNTKGSVSLQIDRALFIEKVGGLKNHCAVWLGTL